MASNMINNNPANPMQAINQRIKSYLPLGATPI